MGELVQVAVDQAVATIRLDRPPMNALNAAAQDEIAAAARQVSADQPSARSCSTAVPSCSRLALM